MHALEPIDKIQLESFHDPLAEFEYADFIAFEDYQNGLFKILKNTRGTCVTMPYVSFLMVIDFINKTSAMQADFPKDIQDKEIPWSEINSQSFDGHKSNYPVSDNAEIPKFIVGFDPAAVGCDVNAFTVRDGQKIIHVDRDENPDALKERAVEYMKNYYGDIIIYDSSHLIDQEVKRTIALSAEAKNTGKDIFPESLCEAILYFNPKFDNVFKVMFQHTEIYFTSTLQVSYPELYAEIKKECGFWCKDTPLYKDLLNFGGDHEEFMINTILKGIFRFRNYGRDKSGDVTAILEEFKEQRNNDLKKS